MMWTGTVSCLRQFIFAAATTWLASAAKVTRTGFGSRQGYSNTLDDQAEWGTINVYLGSGGTEGDFKLRDPPVDHSQAGQGNIVSFLVGRSGFFLDLAANDAKRLSNTLVLERDLGWEG
jgi:hypothetical protein